jgi:hypothetical protein
MAPKTKQNDTKQNEKPLDFQEIRSNGTITLRKKTLAAMEGKHSDWVAVYRGPKPGTIILKLMPGTAYPGGQDSDEEEQ